MKKNTLIASLFLVSFATSAFAGGWAKGYGETVAEATENALAAADKTVTSRKKGCVDGDKVKLAPKEQGMYVVQVHYSHHNGSCGKESNDEKRLKDGLHPIKVPKASLIDGYYL